MRKTLNNSIISVNFTFWDYFILFKLPPDDQTIEDVK